MVGGGYVGDIMGAVMTAIWPIQTKPGSSACNLSVWRQYLGLMHFLWKRCCNASGNPTLSTCYKKCVEQHLQMVTTTFVVSCMW